MSDETPEDADREKIAKTGPRKTLADDLIRAEFAELSRTSGHGIKDASETSGTECSGIEDQIEAPCSVGSD